MWIFCLNDLPFIMNNNYGFSNLMSVMALGCFDSRLSRPPGCVDATQARQGVQVNSWNMLMHYGIV